MFSLSQAKEGRWVVSIASVAWKLPSLFDINVVCREGRAMCVSGVFGIQKPGELRCSHLVLTRKRKKVIDCWVVHVCFSSSGGLSKGYAPRWPAAHNLCGTSNFGPDATTNAGQGAYHFFSLFFVFFLTTFQVHV